MNVNRSRKVHANLRPEDMRVFVAIGCARTLTEAADQLLMPLFTVSRALKRIEATSQVVLIRRDGSGLCLTELGHEYLRACQSALQAHQSAVDVLLSRDTEPHGVLEVAAPVTFVQEVLSSLLIRFLEFYPRVRVNLSLSSDLNQEPRASHDIFFKVGMPTDSRHLMKLFPSIRQGLYASPKYIAAHPELIHPLDLEQHSCLGLAPGGSQATWNLSRANERFSIRSNARITVADPATLFRLAVGSAGITILPRWIAQQHVNTGGLVEVFQDWIVEPAVFCALYNGRLRAASKEGAFLNFLSSILGGANDPRCRGVNPEAYFVHNSSTAKILQSSALSLSQAPGRTAVSAPSSRIGLQAL